MVLARKSAMMNMDSFFMGCKVISYTQQYSNLHNNCDSYTHRIKIRDHSALTL